MTSKKTPTAREIEDGLVEIAAKIEQNERRLADAEGRLKYQNEIQDLVMGALSNLRHGLIALKEGFPPKPALFAAEEKLLRILFTDQEVGVYLTEGNSVIGRNPL